MIPLAPGDATDVAGRTMAEELAKHLKVPVVPVNRPGAGIAIGTDSVAKAKDLTPLGMTTRTPILRRVRGRSLLARQRAIRAAGPA